MRTEEDLRRAMTDAAAEVPAAAPEARQAVARRVRRQRMARLAPIGLVAAAVVFFGAFHLLTTRASKSSVVVTSPGREPRPEPTTPASSPTASPQPTTARTQAAAGTCTTSHLAITAGPIGGAAGHGITVILFRNTGATCRMSGYPGVAALDANGTQLAQASRTSSGYGGGLQYGSSALPSVVLARGDMASATFEGLNSDQNAGGGPCPPYAGLLVTPPGETTPAHVSLPFAMCDLQIHPVVAGGGGGQPVPCGDYAFRPQSSDMAVNITASAVSCPVARSVVAAGPDVDSPNFGKDYTAKGFTCIAAPYQPPPGGGTSGWSYECHDAHGTQVSFDRHA